MQDVRTVGAIREGAEGTVILAHEIPGVRVIELKAYPDARGRFIETFRQSWFEGLPAMVQGNRSDSLEGVLRGLHFHRKQADYWVCTEGRMLAALADLRPGSPTHAEVAIIEFGDGADRGIYIPPGVAHGYYALTDATMTYMVDHYYDASDEFGVAWDDPKLAIPWPAEGTPILSDRDQTNPTLDDVDPETLVAFSA